MKRSEFIKTIERAMERLSKAGEHSPFQYSCTALDINNLCPVRGDYAKVFDCENWKTFSEKHLLVFGGEASFEYLKEMRLNALAMYLAQSLAFKTYKDLS